MGVNGGHKICDRQRLSLLTRPQCRDVWGEDWRIISDLAKKPLLDAQRLWALPRRNKCLAFRVGNTGHSSAFFGGFGPTNGDAS